MSSDPRPSRSLLLCLGLGGLTVVVALVAGGLIVRSQHAQAVSRWTADQALPVVSTFHPRSMGAEAPLNLPAHLAAWTEAPLNARVSGYLAQWTADLGTSVKAGQALARIDNPELDQHYDEARAQLRQAQADAHLAATTAERWRNLLATHSVSRQEADEKHANAQAAQARVAAADAAVARLADLERYKTLRAPFDGVITARHTDVGQLIHADATAGPELFHLADLHRLRLFVPVPQRYASLIHAGLAVTLEVPEHAGRRYQATLLGSAQAVDPRSGTLLAQFAVDNPDGALLPGAYAQVRLPVSAAGHSLDIPASALIFRAAGPQVAELDAAGRVQLHKIHIALDLGARLEIDQGIAAGDRLIDNPPDALRDGDRVRLANPREEAAHAHA